MTRYPSGLLIALALLAHGCMAFPGASYETADAMMPEASRGIVAGDSAVDVEGGGGGSGRVLIRTASIDLEVGEIDEASARIEALAGELGGYVESRDGGEHRGRLTLRVPSAKLGGTLDRLADVGHETSRREDARDVTEQLADLEARLTNDRALRDRLRALLARATDVKDVLAIEAQLNRLQSTVDTQEGQLKRLREDVALSQITVRLTRPVILGPLGYLGHALWWVTKKLFVLRD